jgi:CheY-like chemotaxis protein
MTEAQMTARARRIEREFNPEISRPHHLIGETFHALSIADEADHLLDECACYPRPEVPADDADQCCRTVLVVEDDEPLRVTVSDALRGFGFEVEEAATVGDAKRLLAIIPAIDVLFSDVRLPDGNGFELADWCRQVRPRAGVLLTSGFYQGPTARGEFSVLQKPYSFITLAVLLERLLSLRSVRHQPTEVIAKAALQVLNFRDAKRGRRE